MNGHAAIRSGGDGGSGSNRGSGGSTARWDALLGISPAAWAASVLRTPQLLRQRAFKCKTLEDCLEVETAAFVAPPRCPQTDNDRRSAWSVHCVRC